MDTASKKTHIFLSDGLGGGTWQEMQDMPTGRLNNFCGKITTASSKEEIVVAGGHSGGVVTDTVEIYSVEDNMWRAGW